MQITAAVVAQRSAPFAIETLQLDEPRSGEVLVQIVASGLCHTDLHGRDGFYGTPFPAVFGHEGAGIVLAAGTGVTKVAPGDHVIISFPWCGTCANCLLKMPAHCLNQRDLKMRGTRPDGSTLMRNDDGPVYSAFFQQSSFATCAITQERFVVKIRRDAPLDHIGPLACSVQTGAGAVLNVLQPKSGESFAVFGVGGVGLSSLMAAKLSGCDPIIAIDIHAHRLSLAREQGATHTINHVDHTDVVTEVRKITGGGVRYSIETTAIPSVFREAVHGLMPFGTCVLLGSARPGVEASFEMPVIQNGRTVRGVNIQLPWWWDTQQTCSGPLVDLLGAPTRDAAAARKARGCNEGLFRSRC